MRSIYRSFSSHNEWVSYVTLQNQARGIASRAIKEGVLNPKPCEICGKLDVDAHHEDYHRPLDIMWLCQSHHMRLHGYETRMRNRRLPITPDGKMRAMLGWETKPKGLRGRGRPRKTVTIKAKIEEV